MKGHCHLCEHNAKIRAKNLGILGGLLIVLHLLFHVAELLLLPTLFAVFHHHGAEALSELDDNNLTETTFVSGFADVEVLRLGFQETLTTYPLLK